MFASTSRALRRACFAGFVALSFGTCAHAAILLNDSFADGNRSSTNLPSDSPVWIGQSAGNGSNSTTTGAINFALPTNSLKVWTYFTSDNSAPNNSQPHNAVTQLSAGTSLVSSMSFTLPSGATNASTSRNFRFGIYLDPTDSRVQSDTNSDGGGGTSPWADATGYIVQLPLNSDSSGTNPLQIGKRTTSNTSLAGAGGAYAFAPNGGGTYSLGANTAYTVQLKLDMISSSQLDVTASILQGATVLSTLTVSDLGTTFGGTAIAGGLLPGSQGVYTNFDQLFWRNSDATQVGGGPNGPLNVTNFKVDLVPEPGSICLLGLGGLALRRRRK
jgi:hypothetical protein